MPALPDFPTAHAAGRSVKLLMHHSRNTEQKQWDETLVLALAGATKVRGNTLDLLHPVVLSRTLHRMQLHYAVAAHPGTRGPLFSHYNPFPVPHVCPHPQVLRAHLPAIVVLPGFQDVWEQLMAVAGLVLRGCRRGTTNAAITLITTLIQVASGVYMLAWCVLQHGCDTVPYPIDVVHLVRRIVWCPDNLTKHGTMKMKHAAACAS